MAKESSLSLLIGHQELTPDFLSTVIDRLVLQELVERRSRIDNVPLATGFGHEINSNATLNIEDTKRLSLKIFHCLPRLTLARPKPTTNKASCLQIWSFNVDLIFNFA